MSLAFYNIINLILKYTIYLYNVKGGYSSYLAILKIIDANQQI